MRPAAQFLSLTRQRKKPKKGDPTSATPLLRSGANLRRASVGVGRRTHFALFERSVQTAAASQFTKRLHAALQPPPRQNRAAGAASRGWNTRIGPSLCSAQVCAAQSARAVGGRAKRWPGWVSHPCGRAEKRRAGGGRGHRRMPALRALTRCSCLSGALQARSEFCSATARSSIAGCPAASLRGHGQWGRLLLPSFLGESRKEGAPPGAYPGLTTSIKRQRPTSAQRTSDYKLNSCPRRSL